MSKPTNAIKNSKKRRRVLKGGEINGETRKKLVKAIEDKDWEEYARIDFEIKTGLTIDEFKKEQ